jgi:Neuraminidase (sialidase)
MKRSLTAALLILPLLAGCNRQPSNSNENAAPAPAAAPSQPAFPLTITPVTSPASGDSLAPQITTSSQGAVLSWLERDGPTSRLKFAERTESGWSAPATVASGRDWFVSFADVPSVVRRGDGALVANWLVTTDPTIEAYNLLLSYSRDNGKTWARPFSPHHDGTKTQHGFASFFEVPDQGVGLVWLDGRQQELDTTSPDGGAMSLRSATFDANWKQTSEKAVDVRVCECCSTTAAVTANGVLTAFRDRSDTEVRDIRVAWMQNGEWTAGPLLHADNWTVPACPVNGPALSANGKTVAAAWFTTVSDQGHAFAAFSNDSGRTWGDPIRLDDAASLGYVDIELLDDGGAAATWMEFGNGGGRLHVRRVDPSGAKSAAINVAGEGVRPSGVPRIARVGDELIFAWTEGAATGSEGGPMQVKTAVARVPHK